MMMIMIYDDYDHYVNSTAEAERSVQHSQWERGQKKKKKSKLTF